MRRVVNWEDQSGIALQVQRRRSAVAEAWRLTDEVVVIGAGDPIPVPGRGDLTYPFRAHSDYYYLTDRDRPGGVLAFDPQEGWLDFHPPVDERTAVWLGPPDDAPKGPTTDALRDWLGSRASRPVACLGGAPDGVELDAQLSCELRSTLAGVRRRKDALELERMRSSADDLYQDVRESITELRTQVAERGLASTLREYVDEFEERHDIRVTLRGEEATGRLAPLSASQVLRIVQEALANVRKHARAHTAWIAFETPDSRTLLVEIGDDGVGFDPATRLASPPRIRGRPDRSPSRSLPA